jgi:hypothetical protein
MRVDALGSNLRKLSFIYFLFSGPMIKEMDNIIKSLQVRPFYLFTLDSSISSKLFQSYWPRVTTAGNIS